MPNRNLSVYNGKIYISTSSKLSLELEAHAPYLSCHQMPLDKFKNNKKLEMLIKQADTAKGKNEELASKAAPL